MDVFDKDIGEIVLWPFRPVWMCEERKVHFELLHIKQTNGNTDLTSEETKSERPG